MNDSSVRTCCCVVLCMLLSVVMGITLGGCGSDSPAGPGGGGGQPVVIYDFYVDAGSGNDSNAGTEQAPFKTITHALSVAAAGDSIKVAPGTYNAISGETFPIQIPSNIALIGDETNRGKGASVTKIDGHGPSPSNVTTALLGGHGSLVAGFLFSTAANNPNRYGIYSEGADFTIADNSFDSIYGGVALGGDGKPVVKDNIFSVKSTGVLDRCVGLTTIQGNEFLQGDWHINISKVGDAVVRGNLFYSDNDKRAIAVGQGESILIDSNLFGGSFQSPFGAISLAATSAKLRSNQFNIESGYSVLVPYLFTADLGTSADPGGNVFSGTEEIAIRHQSLDPVYAIGNTWHSASPDCGTEIVSDSGGVVIWGAGINDICPNVSGGSGGNFSFYVSAFLGDDANAGTEQAPFKSITKAMSVALTADSVKVGPGTYDAANGEVFPISIPDGVALIGDEDNHGRGAIYTVICGHGQVSALYDAAVAGSDGGRISGFVIKAEDRSSMRFGVHAEYQSFVVENNDFRDTWGGVWVAGTGSYLIQNNDFTTSAYSIQAHVDESATIQFNESHQTYGILYISGQGQITVYGNSFDHMGNSAIHVNIGSPLIDSNTFTGRYGLLTGAIEIRNTTSPKIRRNDFIVDQSPCIYIYHDATPDLGQIGDPGWNSFLGNSGIAIHHSSTATVNAIGNTWYSTPPTCGTEIIIDNNGVVVWGPDFGESCP